MSNILTASNSCTLRYFPSLRARSLYISSLEFGFRTACVHCCSLHTINRGLVEANFLFSNLTSVFGLFPRVCWTDSNVSRALFISTFCTWFVHDEGSRKREEEDPQLPSPQSREMGGKQMWFRNICDPLLMGPKSYLADRNGRKEIRTGYGLSRPHLETWMPSWSGHRFPKISHIRVPETLIEDPNDPESPAAHLERFRRR